MTIWRVAVILIIWLAVSLPVGLLVGAVIRRRDQEL